MKKTNQYGTGYVHMGHSYLARSTRSLPKLCPKPEHFPTSFSSVSHLMNAQFFPMGPLLWEIYWRQTETMWGRTRVAGEWVEGSRESSTVETHQNHTFVGSRTWDQAGLPTTSFSSRGFRPSESPLEHLARLSPSVKDINKTEVKAERDEKLWQRACYIREVPTATAWMLALSGTFLGAWHCSGSQLEDAGSLVLCVCVCVLMRTTSRPPHIW